MRESDASSAGWKIFYLQLTSTVEENFPSRRCDQSQRALSTTRPLSTRTCNPRTRRRSEHFWLFGGFLNLETSYLPGPISAPVLEMGYLPSRTQFLKRGSLLYLILDECPGCARATCIQLSSDLSAARDTSVTPSPHIMTPS